MPLDGGVECSQRVAPTAQTHSRGGRKEPRRGLGNGCLFRSQPIHKNHHSLLFRISPTFSSIFRAPTDISLLSFSLRHLFSLVPHRHHHHHHHYQVKKQLCCRSFLQFSHKSAANTLDVSFSRPLLPYCDVTSINRPVVNRPYSA